MGSSIGIDAYEFALEHFGVIPKPGTGILMFVACGAHLARRRRNART